MGQIANQMAIEMLHKIKDKIVKKQEENKQKKDAGRRKNG